MLPGPVGVGLGSVRFHLSCDSVDVSKVSLLPSPRDAVVRDTQTQGQIPKTAFREAHIRLVQQPGDGGRHREGETKNSNLGSLG